jgi:protoporphyrinogen oxidase
MKKTAIIIGAGPAGLTAALELLTQTDITPIVLEKTKDIGGISKTVNYKGNRIDIGGHRFFSKSDTVMNYWQNIFKLVDSPEDLPKNKKWNLIEDEVFLQRERLSRIFFLQKFFDYPVSLNADTIKNLGLKRIIKIGFSYLKARLLPIKNEQTLEDFFINRFGKELYLTFFKDYTEKVWGKSCSELSAEWGAQRIKGLSITKVITHYIKTIFKGKKKDLSQKDKETSLIDWFMYPKYGPGQIWEKIAEIIENKGGKIIKDANFNYLKINNDNSFDIKYYNSWQGKSIDINNANYVFSTTSVKNLLNAMENPQSDIFEIANNLLHRDFITVGLLLKNLEIKNETSIKTINNLVPDNWIYMQEHEVKIGRIQIFNNWSPFMVEDENNVWIGLEYFCNKGDELWEMTDDELKNLAVSELEKINIIKKENLIDATVIKMEDTYPVYFGAYEQFDEVRNYLDKIDNLFLIGRSGMHRYNNSDHSMLTAITAVDNIVSGRKDKSNIWEVNTEQEYHEEKKN